MRKVRRFGEVWAGAVCRRRGEDSAPHGRRCRIEPMEDRTLLSAAGEQSLPYLLPQHYVHETGGYLSGPSAAPAEKVARDYVVQQAAQWGWTAEDVRQAIVTDQYTDADTGLSHIYFRQTFGGVEIVNANVNVNVTADGRVLSFGGGFVGGLGDAPSAAVKPPEEAQLTPAEAIGKGAEALGLVEAAPQPTADVAAKGATASVFLDRGLSLDPIPVTMQYVVTAEGLRPAWNMVFRTPDGEHWFDAHVDQQSGELISLSDWVDAASYRVYALPVESPADGSRTLLTDPHDTVTSPYGWHDTNGAAGAEYTDTRGNNVFAQEDADDNDSGGFRPDGGTGLAFDFALDLTQAPTAYQSAAITNLFYWNNILHDVHQRYGFTEVAGNFQQTNYSGQGAGGDAVAADAQDGSGTNNANFSTPPDGSTPRMQMYVFTYTTPYRDGDLDNMIVVHEYGHGVSNRVVGGPANASALDALQSGGMGEGWSDWWGLMFTQKPADTQTAAYPVGTYVLGQSSTGAGIRRYPYSFDKSIDPLTFGVYNSSYEVHDSGEIWCSALWDLNWLLIDAYGYSSSIAAGYPGAGGEGNLLALQLVMDSLKLLPANPTFLDGRDAILQADQIRTGGANFWKIWTAFARRGMGYSADDGGNANATHVTEAFDMPPAGILSHSPNGVSTSPVSSLTFVFTAPMDTATFAVADDVASFTGPDDANLKGQISGFTWTSDTTLQIDFLAQATNGQYRMVLGPQILTKDGAMPMNQDGDTTGGEATDDQYAATFRYDSTVLGVVSTEPAEAGVLPIPGATLRLHWNEPYAPASAGLDDLTLSRGAVGSFTLIDATTVEYALSGITNEGAVTVTVPAGALTDVYGNPSVQYVGHFTADITLAAFPTPLTPEDPLGGLAYEGSIAGWVNASTDTDTLTLDVESGQTITVLVDPVDSSLRPAVALRGPDDTLLASASAAQAGNDAMLQAVAAGSAGTYRIVVSSAANTIGAYSLRLILNAALETEGYGGATNNTVAEAQDLDATLIGVGGGAARGAVLGRSERTSALPNEVEPNNSVSGANAATVNFTAYSGNLFHQGISGSIGTATDADWFALGALTVGDVLTISQSGSNSARGTIADSYVYLYRANGGSPIVVASNDDDGPGTDSLVYRYTVTTADSYYVVADAYGSSTGTYALGLWLEKSGTAPATGGGTVSESEPNDAAGTAGDAASSWRAVQYLSRTNGTITSGDLDTFAYEFQAGDALSVYADSTSTLDARVTLLNSQGATVAFEDGNSYGPGLDSPIYAWVVPTAGTYFVQVRAYAGTGSYNADLYLSATSAPPAPVSTSDYYRFTLADGESATLVLTGETGALELLDSAQQVLASGVSTGVLQQVIENFVDSTQDHVPATYYVREWSLPADYQLLVTRHAAFETEGNNDFDGAQDISGTPGVLGHVSNLPPETGLSADVQRGGATDWSVPALAGTNQEPQASIVLPCQSNLTFAEAMACLQAGRMPASGETADASSASGSGPIALLSSFAGPGATGYIPPDPTAAAGFDRIVAIVNTDLAIYEKSTGRELFRQTMDGSGGFFGSVGATVAVFDPWVLFDDATNRFFALGIDIASTTQSNLFLAVSTTASPSGLSDWYKYKIDFTHTPSGTLGSGAHFPDYPKLGVNDDAIWISGNYFPIDSGSGVYAGITAISKAPLLNGGAAVKLYEEYFSGFSVFPMTQYGSSAVEYLAEASTGGGSSITIHAVSGVLTSPVRTTTTLAVPTFTYPLTVPQTGGSAQADAIDARIMTGVWRDGSMWFAHAIRDPGIGDNEDVARWYQVATHGYPAGGVTLVQSGNVDPGPGVYAWMPAISVDRRGHMAIGFAMGGPNQSYGAGFTGRLASDPPGTTILPVSTLVAGQGYYDLGGSRVRWGDYTGMAIDPADDATFWVFNEYATADDRWATEVGSFQLQAASDADWFQFQVSAGDTLTLRTYTPAGGAGEPTNSLAPALTLYDPAGNLVTSDIGSAGDGRNARLVHTAATAGRWRVQVSARDSAGEYLLSLGLAPAAVDSAPGVIDADPDNGQTLPEFPTSYTLDFSESIRLDTLQAADLVIGGRPALNVTVVDGDTLTFTIDPAAQVGDGEYAVWLPAGAVSDLQGTGNEEFRGTFILDTTGPRIVSTTWDGQPFPSGGVLAAGALTVTATFNEPLYLTASPRRGPFTPGKEDVLLVDTFTGQSFTAKAVSYDRNLFAFTAVYDSLPDGTYTLTLVSGAGAFEDTVGNAFDGEPLGANADGTPTGNGTAGGNYVKNFTLDVVASAYPTPLVAEPPLGSLVYDPAVTGAITSASDTDGFTIALDRGQTLTAVADPATGLRPSLRLLDPTGATVAAADSAAVGQEAVLQTASVSAAGMYTVSVGSAAGTTGGYTLRLILNAAVEQESHDGAANGTRATAQNVDAAVLSLTNRTSRGAVLGTSDGAAGALPNEVEPNDSLATANAAVANFAASNGTLYQMQLTGQVGTSGDSDWFTLGALQSGDVITISESGYYGSRGTLGDSYVYLYRANQGTPTTVTSDDDSGPGTDSLIYRYTLSTADTYYVRAMAFSSYTGSYTLGIWLENAGTTPSTGGTLTAENEPNDAATTANDASSSWRAVQYLSQTSAAMATASDYDYYAYQFTAGDLVSVNIDSTSSMEARVALLDAADATIAAEDGTSSSVGVDSPVYAVRIPSSGTYYVLARSASGSGAYVANVYLSSTTAPTAPTSGCDYYSLTLSAGVSVSLAVNASVAGAAHLAIEDGTGEVVATAATGALNVDGVIHNFVPAASGTYYARIDGTQVSAYNLIWTIGADFDTEINDSFSAAQDITVPRVALGAILPASTSMLRASEDFESGSLGGTWSTYRSDTTNGRIQVTGGYGVGGGSYALLMDTLADGVYNLNEAVWTVNLAGLSQATLSFSHACIGDEDETFSGDFTDHANADGVAISADGVHWHPVWNGDNSVWQTVTVDLGAAAASAGMALGTGFQIKFQQYDNYALTTDGRGWDNIRLSISGSAPDYYRLSVGAGGWISARTDTPAGGGGEFVNTLDPKLALFDAAGRLLAENDNAAPDGRNARLSYSTTAGGVYYLRVTAQGGTSGEYVVDVSAPAVLLSHTGLSTDVAEGGGGDTYSVVLASAPAATVVVSLSPDSQVTALDLANSASLTFTAANWSTPQTVRMAAVDDAVREGPHVGVVAHIATSADPTYHGIAVDEIRANVIDNDEHRPTANGDVYAMQGGTSLSVAALADGLLANDTDTDGDTLTATLLSLPLHGSLSVAANGSFVYQPEADFRGTDQFTYNAADGLLYSAAATVTIRVETPMPLKDVNALPGTSNPDLLTEVNGTLYFVADDDTHGRELWASDGTPAGTRMVKDIYSGTASSSPSSLVNVGGKLFFAAYGGMDGSELWTSDGTDAGTRMVCDIRTGYYSSSYPSSLTDVSGTLYFLCDDGSHGQELWKSDGTSAGTVLVQDVYSGSSGSSISNLLAVGSTLYFQATDGVNGSELWRSDGTAGGTSLVLDISSGPNSSSPAYLRNLNGTVIFSASDSTSGTELWRSDGTAAGTWLLKDIYSGTSSSSPANSAVMGNCVYFSAYDSTNGRELWASDGTAAGTSLLKNIASGSTSSSPTSLVAVNGTLFFSAYDSTNGTELWLSNGTAGGTVLVKDIAAGFTSSSPIALTDFGGTLFFAANDAINGTELWQSDGTAAGTVLACNIAAGSASSSPLRLTNVAGSLLLTADDVIHGREVWRYDSSGLGGILLADAYVRGATSSPASLTRSGDLVFFSAYDASAGTELWRTDGTPSGTSLVKDIYAGSGSSWPQYLLDIHGTLLFSAYDSTNGQELWKSDGSGSGTALVANIRSGNSGSYPYYLTRVNSVAYFTADDGTHGRELWRTDGTSGGTYLVKDILAGTSSSSPVNLTAAGDQLFFTMDDGVHGSELWVSDGTEAGTHLVRDIHPSGGSSTAYLVGVGGVLFFRANDGTNGYELWRSDGTEAGTWMVNDIYPGSNSSWPYSLAEFGGMLYFQAVDASHGFELWRSDGTEAGTWMVKDIYAGGSSSSPGNLLNAGGTLYFTAYGSGTGNELWKSDGTEAGTSLVQDIWPGASSSSPWRLSNVNGTLFFLATTSAAGTELWRSDGTAARTRLAGDIAPGTASSSADYLTALGNALVFVAEDYVIGREVWFAPVNVAPTDIALSSTTVGESLPSGTLVGTFSTTDPDPAESHAYALVSGSGDADNASFRIAGNQLLTAAMFDYERRDSYTIRVRTTDYGGLSYEEAFTIVVLDGDDRPSTVVVNTQDSGLGSLRAALEGAALTPGDVTITFHIPATDPGFVDVDAGIGGGDAAADAFVLRPLTPLPAIDNPDGRISLDARTQTAFGGDTNPFGPEIVLDGSLAGAAVNGLVVATSRNQILGLGIQQFSANGIYITGDGNIVAGNYVGTDATGTLDRGNSQSGVLVENAAENVIGGDGAQARNVLSGNGASGVRVFGNPVFRWEPAQGGNGHYYVLAPEATWAQSEARAVALGGHLASITSAAEQAFLTTTVLAEEAAFAQSWFWFGLCEQGQEGAWGWTSGEAYSFTNWTPGEPDNLNGNESHGILNWAYGHGYGSKGTWDDGGDSEQYWSVIELPALPSGDASLLFGARDNVIAANYVGTDARGLLDLGNSQSGIVVEGNASTTLIGGAATGAMNVVSGNDADGVRIDAGPIGTRVVGNFCGITATGTTALANAMDGLRLDRAANTVVGQPGAGNTVSGNAWSGISVAGLGGTVLEANRIGTDASGAAGLANNNFGVYVSGISSLRIGGAVAGAGNVISANKYYGVCIVSGANVLVQGNRIGTDAAGMVSLGNSMLGVYLASADSQVIANVISGNGGHAIYVTGQAASGNSIRGNWLGTDAAGTAALSNAGRGVVVFAPGTTIGGPAAEDRNVISGNGQGGIYVGGLTAAGTQIQGNYVGTNAAGTAAIGNASYGVQIYDASATALQDNVISGNGQDGIYIHGSDFPTWSWTSGTSANNHSYVVAAAATWTALEAMAVQLGGHLASITSAEEQAFINSTVLSDANYPREIFFIGMTDRGHEGTFTWTTGEPMVYTNWSGGQPSGGSQDYGTVNWPYASVGAGEKGTWDDDSNVLRRGILEFDARPTLASLAAVLRPHDTVIQGNRIGTTADGSAGLGNAACGISINHAGHNIIGGAAAGQGNIISANGQQGIYITGAAAAGNSVQGNIVGLDATGTVDLGNGYHGVCIYGAPDTTVGGAAAGAGNLLSGNGQSGVQIRGAEATGTQVLGNSIGTNLSGTAARPNDQYGIEIWDASGNMIGSAQAGAGNLISGNARDGINVHGSGFAVYTWSVASGGNDHSYVVSPVSSWAWAEATAVQLGGHLAAITSAEEQAFLATNPVPAESLWIGLTDEAVEGTFQWSSGEPVTYTNWWTGEPNDYNAAEDYACMTFGARGRWNDGHYDTLMRGLVELPSAPSMSQLYAAFGPGGNRILGNRIGVNAAATLGMGNAGSGIVFNTAPQNVVGGTQFAGESNLIAFNGGYGVAVVGASSVGNALRGNAIHSNAQLGIDLAANGVTANDSQDADAGANNLQNYPVLTSALISASLTRVTGTLSSLPDATFQVDFYASAAADSSGYGEGQRWLGAVAVVTDGSGSASFTADLTGMATVGDFVTAAATDAGGNTSEFAAAVQAAPANHVPLAAADSWATDEDTLLYRAAPGVLGNDSDPDNDVLAVTSVNTAATLGTLSWNANGAFSYMPPSNYSGTDGFDYTIGDGHGATATAHVTITVRAVADVVGRYVFYNDSPWDGGDPAANPQDYNAIALAPSIAGHGHSAELNELTKELGKQALLPGQTASFVNYTSYTKGLNGILLAFDDLPDASVLTAADFLFRVGNSDAAATWAAAPAPASFRVEQNVVHPNFPGQPDVVTITWANEDPYTRSSEPGAISNVWLQVTVLAGGHTGLAANDVCYWGNQIGESGNSPLDTNIDQNDEIGARNHPHTAFNAAAIYDPYDYNRDARVDQNDEILARNNSASAFTRISLITAPSMLQAASAAAVRSASAVEFPTAALSPIVAEAIARWEATGLTEGQTRILRKARLVVTNLADHVLAEACGALNTVYLDGDAAGFGWFAEPLHGDGSAVFPPSSSASDTASASPGRGKMDLLTAVMHEFGHLLGRPDLDAACDDLMAAQLAPSLRRVLTSARQKTLS